MVPLKPIVVIPALGNCACNREIPSISREILPCS